MTRKIIRAAAAAGIAAALLGGRAKANDSSPAREIEAKVLQSRFGSFDYEVQPSVGDVRAVTDRTAIGTVVQWHEGPLIDIGNAVNSYAVLEVAPTSTASAPIFVRVHLGVVPGNDPLSPDDVERAIPPGTRVISLGADVMVEDPDNSEFNPTVLRDWKTPDGSTLMESHPQGLLFETEDGSFESAIAEERDFSGTGWSASFAELLDDLAPQPAYPEILRNLTSLDYEVQPSASAVQATVERSTIGRVTAWHQGPMIAMNGKANMYAVLEVAPEQILKPAGATKQAQYVRVHLGTVFVDADGEIVEPDDPDVRYAALSLEDVKKAVPPGARVAILGNVLSEDPIDEPEYNPVVLRDWKSPNGSPLLVTRPQGFLVEAADGSFVSAVADMQDFSGAHWTKSFDELVKELRQTS